MKKINRLAASKYDQERLEIIFEYSPIAIWEEDFSALGKLKKRLKESKVKNVRSYLENNHELVKETFRSLKVLDVNKAALTLYGAKSKSELITNLGKRFRRDAITVLIDEFVALLSGQLIYESEFKSQTIGGKAYDVAMRVSVPEVYKDTFERVIVTLQDISVQKKYERHLKKLAQIDGLTNVLNHAAICSRLETEWRRAKRYNLNLSCLVIDLDKFKSINDRYGHPKGDAVLKRTAELLKENLREVDIVGRYGGDEFLIILPETLPENAGIVGKRLCDVFDNLVVGKKEILSTLSIGIGGRPPEITKSSTDLIAKIDKAMYEAKKSGGSKVAIVRH